MTIRGLKANLREQMILRLAGISDEARKRASLAACALLQNQQAWREASSVLFYAPTGWELDVWPLLEEALRGGKIAALPQFDRDSNRYQACRVLDSQQDMHAGKYGIREPVESCAVLPLKQLDFALVPGVAFDLHGRRLGRGKGYYDQLLAVMRGRKCGAALDEQIVSQIPVGPHDSDLNCILTPTRWIEL